VEGYTTDYTLKQR